MQEARAQTSRDSTLPERGYGASQETRNRERLDASGLVVVEREGGEAVIFESEIIGVITIFGGCVYRLRKTTIQEIICLRC